MLPYWVVVIWRLTPIHSLERLASASGTGCSACRSLQRQNHKHKPSRLQARDQRRGLFSCCPTAIPPTRGTATPVWCCCVLGVLFFPPSLWIEPDYETSQGDKVYIQHLLPPQEENKSFWTVCCCLFRLPPITCDIFTPASIVRPLCLDKTTPGSVRQPRTKSSAYR